jgi:hypothetical protein
VKMAAFDQCIHENMDTGMEDSLLYAECYFKG